MTSGNDSLEIQTDLDVKFQENCLFYDKRALAQVLSHIARQKSTQNWVLQTLEAVQKLGHSLSIYPAPVMQARVLETIVKKVDELNSEIGPIGMNPSTIEEQAWVMQDMIEKAEKQAGYGNNLKALNLMLDIAAQAVYGLTLHLETDPESCQHTSRQYHTDNGQPFDKKKEAAPAGTETAEKTNHGNRN